MTRRAVMVRRTHHDSARTTTQIHYNDIMSSNSILSCHHITKTFRKSLIPVSQLRERLVRIGQKQRWTVTAVNDVSFDLHRGEWIGLYGPNGSGKTTLLKMLAEVIAPERGVIERHGIISCFFDLGVGFHDERSGEENVRIQALLQGIPEHHAPRFLQDVRTFADIGEHWNLPFKCYSTGMRLRLGFSVATAIPADIFLLDEIFAVGDKAFQQRCWELLLALKSAGRSAIMVSHGIGDLERICDRIFHMENGRVVQEQAMAAQTVG